MRKAVSLTELRWFTHCPERERRRKLEPTRGITAAEVAYRERFRTLLVRYYSALIDDEILTEAQLRRIWSTMWDIPIQTVRRFSAANSSWTNALLTDEERMIIRGATALNKLLVRARKVNPVIVDEPYSYQVNDKLEIHGRYDLIYTDQFGRFWIVEWTHEPGQYTVRDDIRHAVMLEAFYKRTGKVAAGVLVDFILTAGEIHQVSERSTQQLRDQLYQVANAGHALALELTWKSQGSQCKTCPYRDECLGVKVVQPKRPPGRPRKRPPKCSD